MHVCVLACVILYTRIWRPEVNLCRHSSDLTALFFKTESLTRTWGSMIRGDRLANKSQRSSCVSLVLRSH